MNSRMDFLISGHHPRRTTYRKRMSQQLRRLTKLRKMQQQLTLRCELCAKPSSTWWALANKGSCLAVCEDVFRLFRDVFSSSPEGSSSACTKNGSGRGCGHLLFQQVDE